MTTANYNCSQSELYTISTNAWTSCSQHLAAFTAFKSKYIAGFLTTAQAEITTASNLPDDMQRTAAAKTAHVQLIAANRNILDLFQTLKRYIVDAFPIELHKINFDSAGQTYVAEANKEDWEATESLATSANSYITTNLTLLQTAGFMPTAFSSNFSTAKAAFTTIHNTYLQAEEAASIGTEAKVIANNTLYAKLMTMLIDGQDIFRNSQSIKDQFILDQILFLVQGAGTAGVRGTVTNSITTLPIAGVTIDVQSGTYTAISDLDGKYEISPTAAGTYPISITQPGYEPYTNPAHVILIGTISTLNIQLVPLIIE